MAIEMLKKTPLTLTYWIAFSILGLWATFAYYTMHSLIESQKIYGKLINLSGKQRMLSQKIVLHSHLALEHEERLSQVHALFGQMQADYRFISTHLTSDATREYYFAADGLDTRINQFFRQVEAFMANPTDEDLQKANKYSFELLQVLDKAVTIFEKENDSIVEGLKRRELYIYIGTLITLLLEAIFIITPMIRLHENNMQKLEEEVKKRTKELQIFARIFENSREGMVITDHEENIINVNNAFTNITGYPKEEATGKTPRILSSGQQSKTFYEQMWEAIESKNIWQGEIINKRKDGNDVYENLTIMKIQDEENIRYVSVFTDISERVMHQKVLQYMASHDSLTGVLNRYETIDRINHAIALADRIGKNLALLYIDIDNFKLINDSLGHEVGDKLLIKITRRLASAIRESDTLSRVGGDEFVILLESLNGKGDEARDVANISSMFATPVSVDGREFSLGASIGIVFYPDNDTEPSTAQTLLRKADLAMYKAKELGKNRVCYYDEKLEESISSKLLVEHQLKEAISNHELHLYLQPKVDLENGTIYGAEALIRWIREGELIPPSVFIPVAEETNLIKEIDLWVVHESIRLLKLLHEEEKSRISIAINLSGRTFSDGERLDRILDTIRESGMASFIEIEITEGILIENFAIAVQHIQKVKSLGVSLSLDDFGTGYSSFSYLSNLALDTIKIDQSFVRNLEHFKQQVLVESIIAFSKKLGMKVIAEGIETHEQYEWLREHACHYGQGYLVSKPVRFEEFVNILKEPTWQDS